MPFSHVDNLRFRSYKVLPTEYDNTLSYYETLCKVVDKLNETIDMLNDFEDTYNEFEVRFTTLETQFATILPDIQHALQQVDIAIAEVKSARQELQALSDRVTNLANDLLATETKLRHEYREGDTQTLATSKEYADMLNRIQQADIDSKYTELRAEIRSLLSTYTNQVETLHQMIHNYYTQITNERTQAEQQVLEQALEHDVYIANYVVEHLPEHIVIMNPVRGQYTSLEVAFEDLYTNLRYFAIKAQDFDSWNLTAEEFDALQISAIDFDTNGVREIRGWYPWTMNPFTGHMVPLDQLVQYLCGFHLREAITAREFDNMLLTAQEFDDRTLGAQEFDMRGYNALTFYGEP